MTTLTVYSDRDGATPLATYEDFATIRAQLSALDIELERWEANQPLRADAAPEDVLDAYREPIEALKQKYGFVSVDVVSMHPEHPAAAEARGKFLAEHTHDDFETRFFVDGAGAFYVHADGKVFMLVCTRGDLINLPAHTTHWFDMGEKPTFKAIRFFRIAEGWVGRFTGSEIATQFPKYEPAA